LLAALTATLAMAQSHPSWWAYVPPEATTLVGMRWNHLRHSPLAPAIEAEISPSGALAFPDLDCLRQADEMIVFSPALLAAEAGSFPAATVEDQARRDALRRLVYRGVTLWLPMQVEKLGVAQISEQLILVGAQKTLRAAVDRGLSEPALPYSPLLRRAEPYSQTGDLWVVAERLPDPLAGLFVPLDADGTEFLGQISVRDGLAVDASFDAGSEEAAAEFAGRLREKAPSFPAVARGLEAAAHQRRVAIALRVSSADLMAGLHPAASPAAVLKQGFAGPQPPEGSELTAAAAQPPEPVRFEITYVEDSQPQIIRIFNLDEGTREIEMTHVETTQPQIIRVLNPDEGTLEIVVPPAP